MTSYLEMYKALWMSWNLSMYPDMDGWEDSRSKTLEVYDCLTEEEKQEASDWKDEVMKLYFRYVYSEKY